MLLAHTTWGGALVLSLLAACGLPGDEDTMGQGPRQSPSEPSVSAPEDTGLVPDADDDDGDGLSNDREAEVGTDPQDADTDDDGYTDGAEVEAKTNPLFLPSHPYAGNYNVGYCAGGVPEATGPSGDASYADEEWPVYQPGDVAADFAFVDQYGEDVHLYSFCDRVVMLAFIGSVSDASLDLAAQFQALQNENGPDGFQLIGLLVDQNVEGSDEKKAGAGIVDGLVESYGITTVPILTLGDGQAAGGTWHLFEVDYALPTTAFLGPDMTVWNVDDYDYDPNGYL